MSGGIEDLLTALGREADFIVSTLCIVVIDHDVVAMVVVHDGAVVSPMDSDGGGGGVGVGVLVLFSSLVILASVVVVMVGGVKTTARPLGVSSLGLLKWLLAGGKQCQLEKDSGLTSTSTPKSPNGFRTSPGRNFQPNNL